MTSSLDVKKWYKSPNFHKTAAAAETLSSEELDIQNRKPDLTLCLIVN